ncbi:MAG: hypothetical protein IPN76_11735 [Saprospiraceae bacterium]|nr:hypothetical protein [Saprospiraceae bacterium]
MQDAERFQNYGFVNLVELIVDLKKGCDDTILNISGGYKALIPPLTLMAQLEKMPLLYLYEDSSKLIEIGPLPINFDWGVIEEFIVPLNNENKRKNARIEVIEEMRKKKLIQQDDFKLTTLGNLTAKYSNTASPFTATIFGYLIEHKLFECFLEVYGACNVEHSVEYEGKGDIDILITPKENEFISIEIKPSICLSDEDKMKDIAEKLVERSTIAIEKGERGSAVETWLIVYSYTAEKKEKPTLQDNEIKLLNGMAKLLKEKLNPSIVFRLKHLYIVQNDLKSERHIYQQFMKRTIKANQIVELFNSSEIKNS